MEGNAMRSLKIFCGSLMVALVMSAAVFAQTSDKYTGTVLSYSSGFNLRTRTASFDLIINGETPKDDVTNLLKTLDDDGQDAFLKSIQNNDLGKFSIGKQVGPTINLVMSDQVDGKTRVIAIFQRWMYYSEFRAGARSLDYPFGVVEMYIDPKTGKGEGTYIGAARLDWEKNKKTGEYQLEVNGFATFPSKLLSIKQTAKRLP